MAPAKQSATPGEDWRKRRDQWIDLHRQRAQIELEIAILAAEMDFDAKVAAAKLPPIQARTAAGQADSELLTECEAARYCKVSKSTIARWRKVGVRGPDGEVVARLPHSRAGNRPRYTKKQLDRWMVRLKQLE